MAEVGASSWPCSYTFAGDEPFSEQETRAVRDFLLTYRGRWQAFVTIHSYGQYWMSPWGYTKELPDDYQDLVSATTLSVKYIIIIIIIIIIILIIMQYIWLEYIWI